MGLNLVTSFILSWVCVSLMVGIILVIGSRGREVRNDM